MLAVKNLGFAYDESPVLQSISFQVSKGKAVCLIGESGCGKSTLLKAIYGLFDLDEGEVFWKKEQVLGPAYHLVPGHPKMKYLHQEFDLMPYISVRQNIEKYLSRQHPEENAKRVEELLEITDMLAFAETHVKRLSGGQKQRVALAQVLAKEPELLLLDEPFNFIDNFRKNSLRRNLFRYLKEKAITCVFATHDSKDMLSFADEVLVMKSGKIVSQGSPEHLYRHPKNEYCAALFGEVNKLSTADFNLDLETDSFLSYPEDLVIDPKGSFSVSITDSFFEGSQYLIEGISLNNKQRVYFYAQEALPKRQQINLTLKTANKKTS